MILIFLDKKNWSIGIQEISNCKRKYNFFARERFMHFKEYEFSPVFIYMSSTKMKHLFAFIFSGKSFKFLILNLLKILIHIIDKCKGFFSQVPTWSFKLQLTIIALWDLQVFQTETHYLVDMYMEPSISFQTFLSWHLKLS